MKNPKFVKHGPEVFFIHIMKTAGTSIRRMLMASMPHSLIYPNDTDLQQSESGQYPSLSEISRQLGSGEIRKFRVLCGHYPFFMGEKIFENPTYVVFLRDPLARTISMIEHRKLQNPAYKNISYEQILDNKEFVATQLDNYQSKVFAFDGPQQCPNDVNVPFQLTAESFELALKRLEKVHVVGLTEHFDASMALIESHLGMTFHRQLHANQGNYNVDISAEAKEKILDMNTYDLLFYEHARNRFLQQQSELGRTQ